MAFGNKSTELSQVAVGTYGYILRADTTSILAYQIRGLQAESAPGVAGEVVVTSIHLPILLALVNDANCPDAAFSDNLGEVFLFFKTALYPYVEETRFILIYERNPLKMINANSNADIEDSDMELFMAYAIKHACLIAQQPVPHLISETIRIKEEEIRNANS